MARKTKELRPVMTRLPEGLRRRLERAAAQNGRSMNAEIIQRLMNSFVQVDLKEMMRETARATTVEAIDEAMAKFKKDFGETLKGQKEGQS